jgi:hypothetical protein
MVPIIILGLWIYVFENNPDASQMEKIKMYNKYFPAYLQDNFHLSLVSFISSFIAIVFAAKTKIHSSAIHNVIRISIIITASLIILLQLFTMM